MKHKNVELNIKFKRRYLAIYWAPRILSILFIMFLSLFALDIFDMNLGFWGTILGLFMHLIPSIILIVGLFIAWKYEWVGGTLFALGGIFYIIQLIMTSVRNGFNSMYISWAIIIAGPAFIVSGLFFANWYMKEKKAKSKKNK